MSQDKAPGMTSQTPAVAPPGWWVKLVTGYFLFFSPNLVWLTIALADYFLFPYDYEAAKSLTDLNWVFQRSRMHPQLQFILTAIFKVLCKLCDNFRILRLLACCSLHSWMV